MIAFTIIGSIVIDLLLPIINEKKSENNSTLTISSQNNHEKSRNKINAFKIILFASLAVIVSSVIFGLGPNLDPIFQPAATQALEQLQQNPIFLSWEYVPQFLLVNHPMNILFKAGVETIFFLLPFYYFDARKRENYAPSSSTRTLSFFGQFSLSYYTYSFIFAAVAIKTNMFWSLIGAIVALIVMTLLFRFYLRKAYGGGLIEFVMVTFAIIWKIPPSIKDIEAVYPEKVAQYKQSQSGKMSQ